MLCKPISEYTDDEFLDEMERDAFKFFWEQANTSVGQIRDRAFTNGTMDDRPYASVASTGYGLAAIAIAVERKYIDRAAGEERVLTTLNFILNNLTHEHGFYYHFINWNTGAREWKCELSSIDSTIMLSGIMVVRQYFKQIPAIYEAATKIYERFDWPWFQNGEDSLSMGWSPENGFLKARWNTYCELMMIYVLGIGSKSHPLSPTTWNAFTRPNITYKNITYVDANAPLFTHQFSHAFVDFRNKTDNFSIDYFQNSVRATLAHKQFCVDLNSEFPSYTSEAWGITASDGEAGYYAWGGPPRMGPVNGTIVPCACAGSVVFEPQCIQVLKNLRKWHPNAYSRYSFADALNPMNGWVGADSIGIDLGISLLMAENYRTGFVWKMFMANEEVQAAMKLIGFKDAIPAEPMSVVVIVLIVVGALILLIAAVFGGYMWWKKTRQPSAESETLAKVAAVGE